ncbi:MAG: alpha/beta fold hydrolase [Alphaproteobacteria bacterium]|nr:alpha/beta fold hydrolase [Alphaproteobacteria bacterium]
MTVICRGLAACVALAALAGCGETATQPASGTPAVEPPPAASTFRAATPDPAQGDGGVSAFYDPVDASLPAAAKAGVLIRSEPLEADKSLAQAGRAERILYVSTNGLDGKTPVAVSGALFLPRGDTPPGGWPLIAWAHGTVGIADVCAPSWNARSERDARYLGHWLDQGYAVVASDYQGLGTPGGHPYLATRPAAYSVLDAIRAVQGGAFGISDKVVLVGQSQGGGAAFGTAGYAASYAPELDIRGTVATGTPYFTATTSPATRDPDAVSGVFAYSLLILYLNRQVDPAFRFEDYLNEAAMPTMQLATTACLGPMWQSVEDNKLSFNTTFKQDPTPVTLKNYGLMGYETLKVKGPVFMGTGGKDGDVPPEGQTRLAKDACAAGAVIEHRIYPDLDHSGTVNGSLADSTPFVAKAFAGERVEGNCGG